MFFSKLLSEQALLHPPKHHPVEERRRGWKSEGAIYTMALHSVYGKILIASPACSAEKTKEPAPFSAQLVALCNDCGSALCEGARHSEGPATQPVRGR